MYLYQENQTNTQYFGLKDKQKKMIKDQNLSFSENTSKHYFNQTNSNNISKNLTQNIYPSHNTLEINNNNLNNK